MVIDIKNSKDKILAIISVLLILFCVISGIYIYKFKKSYKESEHPIIEYEDSSRLQYIADPMLEKYLEQFGPKADADEDEDEDKAEKERISYHEYKSSQLIAGDNETFVVSAIFNVAPYDKNDIGKLNSWGQIGNDGMIHCDWSLIIRNVEGKKYQLIDVLKTGDIKEKFGIPQEESTIIKPVAKEDQYTYKIENDDVYVTYDGGENWTKVQVPASQLKYKDDSRDTTGDDLEKGSYYISEDRTAFIYGRGIVYISEDKGRTWDSIDLVNGVASLRRQFIGFTNDGFGYAVIAGDRAMSFEMIYIYTSKDGGHTWELNGPVQEEGSSLATGVSFSTDKIGFISVKSGSINRTEDGGHTWKRMELSVPEELKMYYDTPMAPIFNGNHGELYVGQGDDGDYGAGANQMCRFISDDYGLTWRYDGEVIK